MAAAAPDLNDVFLSSLVTNLFSLFVFLLGQRSRTVVCCYDAVKFAWCLQLVLVFVSDGLNIWLQMVVVYGFFFDFFLLLNGKRCVTASRLSFRFMTNLVHHMTISAACMSENPFEIAACVIAWSTHLFPWLLAMNKHSLFRKVCIAGNFAYPVAVVRLHSTGELYNKSTGELGILAFMVLYRMFYINCKFQVLSRNAILSEKVEDRLLHVFWYWTLALAALVSSHLAWNLLERAA